MAKKLYDEKITKATDWGGDESTGGLPVSGRRVQEFIKGELGRRYGYSRVADEKFLQQFESEEAARLYDEDPERYADLLLSAVQLPGTGETVAIMRVTVLQTPAEYTTEGVTEVFGFRYLSYYQDESDLSPVRGTAVLTVNGLERQRVELRPGSTYSLEVTRYLTEEKNTVQVTVTNNEGSTRNFVYDVNIVNIGLESTFDETEVHTGAVSVRYTPQGNVLKTVHFLVDGEEVLAEETMVNNRQLTAELQQEMEQAAEELRFEKAAELRDRFKAIELLGCYEPSFRYFAGWWQQLFGESEGKDGKGLFPVTAEFTADLHSLGQMIQQGQRNIFETMVRFDAPAEKMVIGGDEKNLDGLNYLEGRTLDFVDEKAFLGTLAAHVDGGVPVITMDCGELNDRKVGELFYFLELCCGVSAYILDVNPFNQPGVEFYKRNMFKLLGKPGYESK